MEKYQKSNKKLLEEEKVNQNDELVSKMSEISISERLKNIKSVEPSEDASESESSSSVAWPSSESSSHFITPRSSDTFKKHTLSAIILKIEKKRRAKKQSMLEVMRKAIFNRYIGDPREFLSYQDR